MTKKEFEDLINRYLSGDASESEEELINDFFAVQERKHPVEDNQLSESMWAAVDSQTRPKDCRDTGDGSRKITWLAVAASVVLVAATVFVYVIKSYSAEDDSHKWVTLDTPYGQKSIVSLPDGTRIFLNGGSYISYPEVFDPKQREVRLQGEAFFEVAPNPDRPFIVRSGDVVTKVLGTSFNVQAFPDKHVSVTVATGRVQVALGTVDQNSTVESSAREVILTPNDQAIYQPGQPGFTVTDVDLERYIAWKDNTLFFENMTLEEAARTLERWYNVTIEFDSDLIKGCRINGKYQDQSLESVLKSIQYMYHIDFDFTLPNKVRLTGDGCVARNTS
jgi:ferric-dicitrate binding protein FerR (iron transport regulator)